MRGVLPVFLVILGLSAREYVDLHVPGGLAHADRAAVVDLAQETAITWYEGAPPQAQRVLQQVFSNMDPRNARRSAGRRHQGGSGTDTLRDFSHSDRISKRNQFVEIRFVLPTEEDAPESAKRRSGRSSRKRW